MRFLRQGKLATAEATPGIDLLAERAEVERLLDSGLLGRSTNVARLLRIICEKFFAGEIDQIKEYTLAVEGLGRSPGFDPQTDPIVRVTAHSLRKRLADYYRGEGADRPVHVSLPLGHYIPHFTHHAPLALRPAEAQVAVGGSAWRLTARPGGCGASRRQIRFGCRPGVAVWSVAAASWLREWRRFCILVDHAQAGLRGGDAPVALSPGARPLRMLVGAGRAMYTDRSGGQWAPDQNCAGGDSFTSPPAKICAT